MTDTTLDGIDQHEAGAKLDAGKPDMSLLLMFGKALMAVAQVGTGGKLKYTRGGWQFVDDGINRYTAAMLRHIFTEYYEEMDSDLEEYLGEEVFHAAESAWNSLARLELILREKDGFVPKSEPKRVTSKKKLLRKKKGGWHYHDAVKCPGRPSGLRRDDEIEVVLRGGQTNKDLCDRFTWVDCGAAAIVRWRRV